MKKSVLLITLFFLVMNSYSQSPSFSWAKSMGGAGSAQANAIKLDVSGNIYSTGIFQGATDFDPDTGDAYLTGKGSFDVFISKLDPDGNFVWARAVGGTGIDRGLSIAIDSAGCVYVTGTFEGTADFNPGAGVNNLVSGGGKDIFILKLNASGNFLWAKKIGDVNDDAANSIAIGTDASVYTTGGYYGTVDFNPGAAVFNLVSASSTAIFVSKLDSSGAFVWAKSMGAGNGSGDYGADIALDKSNNVYTTGGFFSDGDFDPGAGTFTLTNIHLYDVFISKLDASGNFVWAKGFGGTGPEVGRSIKVDAGGNVYSTGFFAGVADFDPGVGTFQWTSIGQTKDVYISKLDAAGDFVWAKQIGGSSDDVALSLDIDKAGNAYTYGTFKSKVDFNPGAGLYFKTSQDGSDDNFISKLDASGNFAWACTFQALGTAFGTSITLDANGNVFSAGGFAGYIDCDPNPGVFYLNSKNGWLDIFIHKLSQKACVQSSANIAVTTCSAYLSPSGKYAWGVSNTYKDTITNVNGCDSVLTINLTIPVLNLTVSKSAGTLTSNANGAAYQWIDCNNGNKPISGKTTQSFKPTVDGNYAVIVTVSGCSDTSVCNFVTASGINMVNLQNVFEIYPNPSNGIFNMAFSGQQTGIVIEVYNTIGALVCRMSDAGVLNTIDISDYSDGLYIVKVKRDDNLIATRKIIKQ